MNSLGDVVEHYLLLSSLIFTIGGVGFLVRRNVLVQLMSIELMLNSVNLLLVAYNRVHPESMTGNVFAFFVIAVAAAEVAGRSLTRCPRGNDSLGMNRQERLARYGPPHARIREDFSSR
jgi:NADH:ubiquinone oxidoreductase subunit K